MPLNFPVQMIQGAPEPVIPFWVDVTDAGNDGFDYLASYNTWSEPAASKAQGHGGVDYNYQISKYAIRVSYIDDIYNAAPENSTKQLVTNNDTGYPDNPVVGLTWNEAARFVNWLNEREGEQPAYKFTTDTVTDNLELWSSDEAWQHGGENLYRHKAARYFLPSWDEYLKAGYYDPNHGGAGVPGYWRYPQSTNTAPTAVANGTTQGTAVYNQGTSTLDDDQRAGVDDCGGVSTYGCMGMAGNTYEYIETAFDLSNDLVGESRILKGGTAQQSTSFALSYMSIGGGLSFTPGSDPGTGGFRVARAPVGTGEAPA